jgi:hypothetical protein
MERRGWITQFYLTVNQKWEEPLDKTKPFDISKHVVWEAYLRVKANKGAAGIDEQSIADFERELKNNLYKIWNRMSSGSYFPPPVRTVSIPKSGGGLRKLGIPTVGDRIAQMVVKLYLEPENEIFPGPGQGWSSFHMLTWLVTHTLDNRLNTYKGHKQSVEIYTETCVWYKSGHEPVLIRWVLVRDPQGEFDPQAFVSTNPGHTPLQILTWFVRRWLMEVTFEEARAHLGIETQRQWSDLAIARTTPALFGLFSIVTLMTNQSAKSQKMSVRTAAWYKKELPAFADTIALVRRCLWSSCHFSTSSQSRDVLKVPRSLLERLTDAVSYAA